MAATCPQCHSGTIIEGKIYNQVDYVNPQAFFRPKTVPFYAIFFTNILLENKFFACSFCGLIWSKVDTESLQSVLVKKSAI